jgi:hypothetical protein
MASEREGILPGSGLAGVEIVLNMNRNRIAKLGGAVAGIMLLVGNGVRAEEHATFPVGEFNFKRPAGWEWVDVSSPARKAQLKVKDADGKGSAEVTFFLFSGGAGSTQANVDRWLGLFEEGRERINAKVEETTIGKTKVTYVQAEGTYKSGMPGGLVTSMPNYGLLGAILESKDGNIFVKMTGPKALVKASAAEFRKMVESGPKKE